MASYGCHESAIFNGLRGTSVKLKEGQTLYIVPEVMTSCLLNNNQSLKMSWADGQIGACPIFTNKKKAFRYMRDNGVFAELVVMKVDKVLKK
jgi:hypothetical protein